MTDLDQFACILDDAARTATAVPQLTEEHPHLTVEDAYAIQKLSMDRRYDRGEHRVGVKMGLTSRAKMLQVGVSEVVWGRLTDAMRLVEGGDLVRSRYVHPRVEPEIAYIIGKQLAGDVSPVEALAAVEAIAPAVEIIDSRFRNFKFTLPDVVADNASSSGLHPRSLGETRHRCEQHRHRHGGGWAAGADRLQRRDPWQSDPLARGRRARRGAGGRAA